MSYFYISLLKHLNTLYKYNLFAVKVYHVGSLN